MLTAGRKKTKQTEKHMVYIRRMTAKTKVRVCMQALKGVIAEAPVQIGDVILADVAETGVDIIATKEISEI